ncbi:hypothetical protein DSM104299_02254 [Baekduia alba]|uniref:hypothetical protein n=1 Tax=Baekduia alba TaxID=2997333 RepID=UPI002340688D|nr:hypothetical protein [Baekduia alba]WCB93541.1 hypothetical protein DSM104299_02254 [Baekduia alba]
MTDGIVMPIVVAEGLDVTFHRSAGDVGAFYESWFPASVEHRAFDAEGRRLELYAEGTALMVRARDAAPGPEGAAELAQLLRELLRGRRDHDAMLDELTLAQLLDLAVARAGFLP